MAARDWRPDIQGLRAVAVGLVIAAHAGVPGFGGGFVGVDVFFVLSGFLITSLLLREVESTGRVSLVGFYARRARRILPAATVTAICVLAYAAIALPRTRVSGVVHDALWSTFFLANVHFARLGTDYFADTTPSPFQHYWSLSVEEQFYLVWPLLVLVLTTLAARRLGWSVRRTVGMAAAVVGAGSLLWALVTTASSPAAAYFSTPSRAYELAGGGLLACWRGRLRTPYGALLGLGGFGALVVATVKFSEETAFPGSWALVPVVATVALIAAGPATGTGRVLSLPLLRRIGDLSYSLYLWHWPVLVLAPTFLPEPTALRTTLAVAIALLLAALSHRYVELPFQTRRVPFLSSGHRSVVLWPAAVVATLVAISASTAYADHLAGEQRQEAQAWFTRHGIEGHPSDIRSELHGALRLADQGAPIPPGLDLDGLHGDVWQKAYPDCYAGDGDTTAPDCALGDTSADRTIAIVGDSHAGMWLTAFDQLGREHHYRVVPFVKLSCAAYPVYQPAKAMTQKECDDFRTATLTRLRSLRPNTIVVASRGELFMREHDGRSVDEQWSQAVHTTVRQFTDITTDVHLLADIPAIHQQPGDCLSAPGATQRSCLVDPTGPEMTSNPLTEAATRGTTATYVDVLPLVCADRCPLVVGDRIVYHDDAHLTASWVGHITPELDRLLGRLPRDT